MPLSSHYFPKDITSIEDRSSEWTLTAEEGSEQILTALREVGIYCLCDFRHYSIDELLSIPHFAHRKLARILMDLASLGIHPKESPFYYGMEPKELRQKLKALTVDREEMKPERREARHQRLRRRARSVIWCYEDHGISYREKKICSRCKAANDQEYESAYCSDCKERRPH